MSVTVKLKDLIEEMQIQIDEYTTYFNKKTGEFVSISDKEFQAAEEKEDNESFFDVEEEGVKIAIDILENSNDYIEVPSKYDIHEYDIMKRFCLSLENDKDINVLLIAIRGAGAFRRFKDMIHELGIEEDWYKFRDEKYKEIAIEWCNDNGISFEE
jgi:predicted phosphoadenosine phosphosulfate sulfurtransferase